MKTNFKRIVSVILIAVMLLCSVPFTASAATYSGKCGTNVSWSLSSSTNTLTISGTGSMYNYEMMKAPPWQEYKYSVNIRYIKINNGVTSIGDYAFNGLDKVTSVSIPNSVTHIGDSAFRWCYGITSISIPNSVTYIDDYAFCYCTNLRTITIPDSVKTIGVSAFAICQSLRSVTIPASVTTISSQPFSGCTGLTQITVNSSNPYFSSDTYGVLFNKNKSELIQYPAGNTRTSYTIPNSVKTIGTSAFNKATYLTNVTIPDSVTYIGDWAFDACEKIRNIYIPDSVTRIGVASFRKCYALTSATIGNGLTAIENSTFNYCENLKNITIGNNVKSIGFQAFYGCKRIKSIMIPKNVKLINEYAFSECTGLGEIYYGGSKEEWSKVSILQGNDVLLKCKILFKTPVIIYNREFEKNLDYYAENLNSSTYDPVLANMMAALSQAVYSEDDIKSACKSLWFSSCEVYDYQSGYNALTCGYSMAFKQSDYSDDIICLIAVRGSQNLDYNADWIGNLYLDSSLAGDEKHPGFARPADKIYTNIQNYIKANNLSGNIKYFITGHSRGAAVANLLSVKLMENGTESSNIYNYNFACPDVACKYKFQNYNNIFNLCNREDIVPFVPGNFCSVFTTVGTSWGKFGKTYWFTKDAPDTINPFADHNMEKIYLEFFDQQLEPSAWGKSFDDKVDDLKHQVMGWVTKILCPVDVTITDKEGNKVVSVIDGNTIHHTNKFGEVIVFTDGDKKVIFINSDKEFDVNLIGTDNGEMTYSVEHYNVTTEEVLESKTFSNVKLEDGKQMVSSINSKENMSDIELLVTKEENGKDIITHNVDTDGTETECYWRNVESTKVTTPSTTTVNYGETLVLRVEDVILPAKYTVEWIVDGSGFSKAVSEDSLECMLTSNASGTATVTVRIVDENGEVVLDGDGNEISDSIELKSNAGFFQKLISFFKNLFRMNRVIY